MAIGLELPVVIIFTLFAIPFVISGVAQYLIRSENIN
jgi:hypothetical protein